MAIEIDIFEELRHRLEREKKIHYENIVLHGYGKYSLEYENWLRCLEIFLTEKNVPSEDVNLTIEMKKKLKNALKTE